MKHPIWVTAFLFAAVSAAVLWAGQDKPVAAQGGEAACKLIVPIKAEHWKAKDNTCMKLFEIDTDGYAEVRITVTESPLPGGKFGKDAKRFVWIRSVSSCGNLGDVSQNHSKVPGTDTFIAKVVGKKTSIFVRYDGLDVEDLLVTVDAYLVR